MDDAKAYTDAEWANVRLNTGASGKMWQSAVLTVDALRAEVEALRSAMIRETAALRAEVELLRGMLGKALDVIDGLAEVWHPPLAKEADNG